MTTPDVRKGMPPAKLPREEFVRRYRNRFVDPAFKPLQGEIDAIIDAAWDAYSHSRKSPVTRKAGPGFADPEYELAVDWLAAREAILAAQRRYDDAADVARILIINGSSRSKHTCPGEMSKIWRLVKLAEPVFVEMGLAADILDLSRLPMPRFLATTFITKLTVSNTLDDDDIQAIQSPPIRGRSLQALEVVVAHAHRPTECLITSRRRLLRGNRFRPKQPTPRAPLLLSSLIAFRAGRVIDTARGGLEADLHWASRKSRPAVFGVEVG